MSAARELKPSARAAHVARLGALVNDLLAAGDRVGASIAATQLARLVADGEGAAPGAPAPVIDLHARRKDRTHG